MGSKAAKLKDEARDESMWLRIQGAVAVLFGAAAVWWPGLTFEVLVYLFAAFMLADGLVLAAMALPNFRRDAAKAWLLLLLGILQLGIGAYLLPRPEVGFNTLVLVIGLAFVARGLFWLARVLTGRMSHHKRLAQAGLGALSVAVGVIILMQPVGGGLGFVWAVGLYAIVAGATMLLMSADITKTR